MKKKLTLSVVISVWITAFVSPFFGIFYGYSLEEGFFHTIKNIILYGCAGILTGVIPLIVLFLAGQVVEYFEAREHIREFNVNNK